MATSSEGPDGRDRRIATVAGVVVCAGIVVAITTVLAGRGRESPDVAESRPQPASSTSTTEPAAETSVAPSSTAPSRPFGNGLVSSDIGCVDDLSATSLDAVLQERLGAGLGIGSARVIRTGTDQFVWFFADAFLDYSGEGERMSEAAYVPNVAVVQTAQCFQMLHRGSGATPRPFEVGSGAAQRGRFFWPLGGEVGENGDLYVFWAEMQEDPRPSTQNGIRRHPVGTWLGIYDPASLSRVGFARAPDPDVAPQYGSAVQTDGEYSYLFGNTNVLNLEREGGYDAGPFSGTREYLARVPAGEFTAAPEYFAGSEWSSDATAAEPISTRFYTSNAMQPRLIDGTWYSVVKEDDLWGERLLVERADDPWGPWTTVQSQDVTARVPAGAAVEGGFVTYQPVLLPWQDDDGALTVLIAQNSKKWSDSVDDPRRYRPRAIAVDIG